MILIFVCVSLFHFVYGCNYYQSMVTNQQYYIYNEAYPNTFRPLDSCQWTASSAVGTRIILNCNLNIVNTNQCNEDHVSVSLTGNSAQLVRYCGTGSLNLVSDTNQIIINFFATSVSPGGRFICEIRSVPVQTIVTPAPTPAPTCNCGIKSRTRIIGGQFAGVNEFPFMAALVNTAAVDVFCGGAIISQRFVLTAAHCVHKRSVSTMAVLAGDHDISTGSDTSFAALYQIDSYLKHEAYDPQTQKNDIALVQTVQNIVFNTAVGPICLPFLQTSSLFVGSTITALGWGVIQFSGPKSDILQKVNLQIISNNVCQQRLPDESLNSGQICAYSPNKDTCTSDSGGPLAWLDSATNRWKLIGIVSYGIGCNTTNPSVNTRVTSYLNWVTTNSQGVNYCSI